MSRISFNLEAQEGMAVSAFMKLVEAQRRTEVGMERLVKRSKDLENAGTAAGNAVRSGLSNLANLAITGLAGGGLTAFAANTVQNLRDMRGQAIEFNDDMRGLLSVGNNLDNIGSVKAAVLDLSSAWGISRKEIAAAMFDLQSGTANLDAATQNQILKSSLQFTQLVGGELPVNMKALIKTFQIYREELGTVDMASAKVFRTGELGYMTFAEMAQLLPDVLPPAKAMGVHFDEVAGALITATQYGGKSEKTFTGVRNVILRMSKAEEEGIQLTGSLSDKLEQLSKVDPETLKRIFGDEAIAVIATLAERVKEVRQNIDEMRRTTETAVTDRVAKRLADPTAVFADVTKSTEQLTENVGLSKDYVSTFGRADNLKKFLDLGIALETSPMQKALGMDKLQSVARTFDLTMKEAGVAGDYSRLDMYVQRGVQAEIDSLRRAGKRDEADYLELAYSRRGDNGVTLPGVFKSGGFGGGVGMPYAAKPTLAKFDVTEQDAQRYLRMRAAGEVRTPGEFISRLQNERLDGAVATLGGIVPPREDAAFERAPGGAGVASETAMALAQAAADMKAASQLQYDAAEIQRQAANGRRDFNAHQE